MLTSETSPLTSKKIHLLCILQVQWGALYPFLLYSPQLQMVEGTCPQRLQMIVRIRIGGRERACFRPGHDLITWQSMNEVRLVQKVVTDFEYNTIPIELFADVGHDREKRMEKKA